MKAADFHIQARRKFLKLLGGGVTLATLSGLAACSGEKDAPPPAANTEPAPAPKPTAPANELANEPAKTARAATAPADQTPAPAVELAQISEDDTQAKALGYVHDAATVDKA